MGLHHRFNDRVGETPDLCASSRQLRRSMPRASASIAASFAGLLVAGLSLAVLPFAAPARAQDADTVVTIEDLGFSPPAVTVDVGDTVEWRNHGTRTHTTTSEGNWDSGDLEPGDTFSFTFTTPGTYPYTSLPDEELRGTVTVGAPVPSRVPSGALPPPGGQDRVSGGLALLVGVVLLAAALVMGAVRLVRREG